MKQNKKIKSINDDKMNLIIGGVFGTSEIDDSPVCLFYQKRVSALDEACSMFVYRSGDMNYSANQCCGMCKNFRDNK